MSTSPRWCAQHPERLLALGSVALQHPELCWSSSNMPCGTLGLRGIEVSSQVNGLELADARFERFWARAEELGCIVFLHPLGTSSASASAGTICPTRWGSRSRPRWRSHT